MSFKAAPVNHGVKFQRVDLDDQPILNADVNRVVSTNRGTTIKQGEAQVSTIEHVLSALTGMGVDNVLIEIDGPEIPIMDGSEVEFVKLIDSCIRGLDGTGVSKSGKLSSARPRGGGGKACSQQVPKSSEHENSDKR